MPRTDFNGDGRDDIFWRNTQTGIVTNWLGQSNGGFVSNDENALDPWAHETIMGNGDFNGDGRTDTLMRQNNGAVFEVYLSLTEPSGAFYFYFNSGFVAALPHSWNVAGTGDFNGDGFDDIIWRRDDGAFTEWLAQPNLVANGAQFVSNDANAWHDLPTSWQVVGTGDFNGDGRDDIIWRPDDGAFTEWLGQASGGFLSNDANAWTLLPTSWQVAGTGDFNGDHRDDIIWRRDDGAFTEWLSQPNGGFVSNDANAWHDIPTYWHVAATGDYNGDGRDDVLWRRDDGAVTNWLALANGGFVSNDASAWHDVPNYWVIQPNQSGVGIWDY